MREGEEGHERQGGLPDAHVAEAGEERDHDSERTVDARDDAAEQPLDADAVEDLTGTADEGLTWRLGEAARNADRAQRSGQEDTAEYDIAENGAHISRDERSAFDALLGSILKGDAKDKK